MPFADPEREKSRQKTKYQTYKEKRPFWQKCVILKGKAKEKGLAFNLTEEFLKSIWTGKCALSGMDISLWMTNRREEHHAELDRIIPDKGYVQSNVIWVSRRFNRIKQDGTADEHRMIADKLDEMKEIYGK